MEIFPLLICLWYWPRTWRVALLSFLRWCIRRFVTWFLLPIGNREVEYRIEIFAGWFIPAAIALAITWVVWRASEVGGASGCSYGDIHKCFPPGLIGDMFIHGGIAAGVGGSIHLVMLREALDRARAAETRLDEARKRDAEAQKLLNDERQEHLDEARKRDAEAQKLLDEERARTDRERKEIDRLREELRKRDEQSRNGNGQ